MDAYDRMVEFSESARTEIRHEPARRTSGLSAVRGIMWGAFFSIPLWVLAFVVLLAWMKTH